MKISFVDDFAFGDKEVTERGFPKGLNAEPFRGYPDAKREGNVFPSLLKLPSIPLCLCSLYRSEQNFVASINWESQERNECKHSENTIVEEALRAESKPRAGLVEEGRDATPFLAVGGRSKYEVHSNKAYLLHEPARRSSGAPQSPFVKQTSLPAAKKEFRKAGIGRGTPIPVHILRLTNPPPRGTIYII